MLTTVGNWGQAATASLYGHLVQSPRFAGEELGSHKGTQLAPGQAATYHRAESRTLLISVRVTSPTLALDAFFFFFYII